MAITYRINSYEEHIKHDLELNVTNVHISMTGILRLTRDKGYKFIFHGIRCDVRQIKDKLDIFGVESLKVLAYDEFNSFGERTLVFDFKVDTSIKHEIDYSAGGASKLPKADVIYSRYVNREFTVSITKPTGESYTFYGNEDTAVYANAREISDFYDKALAGSGVRKVVWHWFYSPQMDKWIKMLAEIRFIKYDFNENHRFFDFSGTGHRCKILNVTVDQIRCCRCITLRDFDAAKDFCLIIEDGDFGIFGGNLSDLDCAAIYREWIVKKIEVMVINASDRAVLKRLWVSDDYEAKEKEYAKKTIVVTSGAINGSAFHTDTINEPRWLTYNPALINISACDFIKEEKEMKKEINAQAVWNSMSKAQQELCCDLIGNAAKGKISEELKMSIINTKISRYSGKVRGEDIRDIIFNGPATIILWRDGTKTVVKQQNGDKWDPEKAVALAVMKKTFGTNATGSNYLEFVKPYIEKAYEDEKKRKAAARRKKKVELNPDNNE